MLIYLVNLFKIFFLLINLLKRGKQEITSKNALKHKSAFIFVTKLFNLFIVAVWSHEHVTDKPFNLVSTSVVLVSNDVIELALLVDVFSNVVILLKLESITF